MYRNFRMKFFNWLVYEPPMDETPPYDFSRLKYEIRQGDVLLVEGRSRVSAVIRSVMQSTWTHAALYIGRLSDIEDEELHHKITSRLEVKGSARLIIEDILDKGTTVNLLTDYEHHHLRICRPIGIDPTDLQAVIAFAINSLGQPYNVKDLLDLFRFSLPWSILPKRWGSNLFRTPQGEPESSICTSLIANAFASVKFPILPFVQISENGDLEAVQRSPYLFTPRDFDFSPYFDIIKYPLFNPEEPLPYYRRIPWSEKEWPHDKSSSKKTNKLKKDADKIQPETD